MGALVEGSRGMWLNMHGPLDPVELQVAADFYGGRLMGVRWDRHGITPAALSFDVDELRTWSNTMSPGSWHAVYSQADLKDLWDSTLRDISNGKTGAAAIEQGNWPEKIRLLYRALVAMQRHNQGPVIEEANHMVSSYALEFVLSPTNVSDVPPIVAPSIDGCMPDQLEGPCGETWVPSRTTETWTRHAPQDTQVLGLGFEPTGNDVNVLLDAFPDVELVFVPGDVELVMSHIATRDASQELDKMHADYHEEHH
jgi:hypothetical protein